MGELCDAFRQYHVRYFWSWSPDTEVVLNDLPEIIRGLRMHGGGRVSSCRKDQCGTNVGTKRWAPNCGISTRFLVALPENWKLIREALVANEKASVVIPRAVPGPSFAAIHQETSPRFSGRPASRNVPHPCYGRCLEWWPPTCSRADPQSARRHRQRASHAPRPAGSPSRPTWSLQGPLR